MAFEKRETQEVNSTFTVPFCLREPCQLWDREVQTRQRAIISLGEKEIKIQGCLGDRIWRTEYWRGENCTEYMYGEYPWIMNCDYLWDPGKSEIIATEVLRARWRLWSSPNAEISWSSNHPAWSHLTKFPPWAFSWDFAEDTPWERAIMTLHKGNHRLANKTQPCWDWTNPSINQLIFKIKYCTIQRKKKITSRKEPPQYLRYDKINC